MRYLISLLIFICSATISFAQQDSIILRLPKGAERIPCKYLHIPHIDMEKLCFKFPGFDNEFIMAKSSTDDTNYVLKFYKETIATYTNDYHILDHDYVVDSNDAGLVNYSSIRCTLKDEYYDSTSWFEMPDGSVSPYDAIFTVFEYKGHLISVTAHTNTKADRELLYATALKLLVWYFNNNE